jgi:hypothetical protein
MFSPQLADYDGDGRLDLIAGSDCCQEGCFYLFRGQKNGGYAARQAVKPLFPRAQFDDRQLQPDSLQSRPAEADLNGDGKSDVLLGGNHEETLAVAYGPLVGKDELTVQRMWPKGQEPFAPMLLSTNPVLADWDGDGLLDLIQGAGEWGKDGWRNRGVYWYRNVGTKRVPKFGPSQLLIADNDRAETTGICVADWNGDGRPDLIASRLHEVDRDGKGRFHQKVWVYLRRGG